MSLFEKIEFEGIETQEIEEIPESSRKWTDETFVVAYPWTKKLFVLFCALAVVMSILPIFMDEVFFFLEVFLVFGFVAGIWYLNDLILTTTITFTPHGITKSGYVSQTEIQTDSLVMDVNEQVIHFFHATEKNVRESVKISRTMITAEDAADILSYAADVYRVKNRRKTGSEATGKNEANSLALTEYLKAVASYRMTALFFVTFTTIALFTAGLTNRFYGLTPDLPAYPVRLLCIVLALAGFFLLKQKAASGAANSKGSPLEVRLKQAENSSFTCSLTSNAITLLGLLLFLMFGNLFDFYLFLLIGVLYFVDFYPRFSIWERAVRDSAATASQAALTPRRRSLHVSLVLMGALAVSSYGESQNYLYSNRKDCVDDWGDGQDCREVQKGGGGSGGYSRYYGPRYRSGGRAPRSVGVGTISRGGFGSLGSFHGSFGG